MRHVGEGWAGEESQELGSGTRCLSDMGGGAGVSWGAWLALGFGELSAYGWGWLGTPREGIDLGSQD